MGCACAERCDGALSPVGVLSGWGTECVGVRSLVGVLSVRDNMSVIGLNMM